MLSQTNSVVTLVVNSRGWSSLCVVFSQTRHFPVIAFAGWIYLIENFFTLPWKTEFEVKFSTVLNRFFTIQDFWATCVCPEKQSLSWNFYRSEIFFIIQDFWATSLRLPWKTQLPWSFSLYWNFFFIQDFWATYACPENSLPWSHSIGYIFFII